MTLSTSTLSQVCIGILGLVKDGLNALEEDFKVIIGNIGEAAKIPEADNKNCLNLFFFQFEPSGFYPYTTPEDTWWIRLHCLITAFGWAEDNTSASENELRLLGNVMRLFHQEPIQKVQVNGEEYHLQVVYKSLSSEQLNNIWSSQGEVSIRPSISYEMALSPVEGLPKTEGGKVAGFGIQIHADMAAKSAPFEGQVTIPPVTKTTVDITSEDWAPFICLVHDDNCIQIIALTSEELESFEPLVWIAGDPDPPPELATEVTLVWEKWTSGGGWERIEEITVPLSEIQTNTIDPDDIIEDLFEIDLPENMEEVDQAILYAERKYVRTIDQAEITVKSNLLLLVIHEEE